MTCYPQPSTFRGQPSGHLKVGGSPATCNELTHTLISGLSLGNTLAFVGLGRVFSVMTEETLRPPHNTTSHHGGGRAARLTISELGF